MRVCVLARVYLACVCLARTRVCVCVRAWARRARVCVMYACVSCMFVVCTCTAYMRVGCICVWCTGTRCVYNVLLLFAVVKVRG